MVSLPILPSLDDVRVRLQLIFPEGCPNRAHAVWDISARTIFVMLYVGAVEGSAIWMRPDQVGRMTGAQSKQTDDAARRAWERESRMASKGDIPGRWFAVNSRESIRDDTIRFALIPNGAVVEREGLATTSPAPRYALKVGFAALFDPSLTGMKLSDAVETWRSDNLSAGALARIAIRRRGAAGGGDHVMVKFPNGETRRMAPGASSLIAKAVVEEFAPAFLGDPGVIWMSESRNKVVSRDDELARSIGLSIQPDRNLPDIILVDLAPKHPLLVYVEVVATDGPVSDERKAALTALAREAGFPAEHLAFVTAYLDRSEQAFKRTVDMLAWGTFVWFASEPRNLLRLYEGRPQAVKVLADWD
jgi:BsuBI/PstI restriction endonuclease domain/BsuBI/PstI restriction endonuclease HTH domain